MLRLSLSIMAVVRALCAFLSYSRVHFIFAYCTVFNERINDDDDDYYTFCAVMYIQHKLFLCITSWQSFSNYFSLST